MTNKEVSNVLRLFANLIEINGLPQERIMTFRKAYEQAITELESDERPQGEIVIKCKDCKYQVKEWREDKRMKDKGFWVYGCNHFGEIMGYWGFGGNDNEFCSDAERKGGAKCD